jgi:hypothetical protein
MMAADTTHRAQYMMARDAAGGKFRRTSVILRLKSRRSGIGSSEIPEQLQDDFTEAAGQFCSHLRDRTSRGRNVSSRGKYS